MMILWRGAVALVLLGLLSIDAVAQSPPSPIRGLKEFRLAVDVLNQDGNGARDEKGCGVTTEQIESSVRFIVQQSKIRLSDRPDLPLIRASALILRLQGEPSQDDNCVASLSLNVMARATVNRTGVPAFAVIWSRLALMSYLRGHLSRDVSESYESMAKQLVSDWSRDNN